MVVLWNLALMAFLGLPVYVVAYLAHLVTLAPTAMAHEGLRGFIVALVVFYITWSMPLLLSGAVHSLLLVNLPASWSVGRRRATGILLVPLVASFGALIYDVPPGYNELVPLFPCTGIYVALMRVR